MKNIQLETVQEKSYLGDFVFHHKTTILEENVHGYGTSINKSISVLKSINEAIERYYFKNFYSKLGHKTSNGLSCNSNELIAIESAKAELIERHLLLSHWIQKISPSWILSDQVLNHLRNDERSLYLMITKQNFYDIKFGILGVVNDIYVVVSAVRKTNVTGYAVATSADRNLSIAISKCLDDAVRVIDLIESRVCLKQDIYIRLTEEEVVRPADHLEFYLDPENWESHTWFFEATDFVRKYTINNITTSTLHDSSIPQYNVFVASAKCDEMQELFFGKTEVVNLNKYNRENLKNKCIHPLA